MQLHSRFRDLPAKRNRETLASLAAQHGAIAATPTETTMTNPNLATMSKEQLLALIATMQASPARKMSVKVSEKGAMSIYGFGRFPFTFYKSQFDALFTDENIAALRAFRTANDALLASKD
jgi:hypothetical protein